MQRSNVEFCAAWGNGELQREELDGLELQRPFTYLLSLGTVTSL